MSPSLDSVKQTLNEMISQVQALAPGGDLESLLEERLTAFDRQFYEYCLHAREQAAASPPEAFPPGRTT